MKAVIGFVVIVAVILALRFRDRGADSDAILAEIKSVIVELDVYDANADYIDMLVESYHGIAFNQAYEMGGRRRKAEFDMFTYTDVLFDRMIDSATMMGKKDVTAAFVELRAVLKDGIVKMTDEGEN